MADETHLDSRCTSCGPRRGATATASASAAARARATARPSGRGQKGQKSRSGSHSMRPGFEGGQMPLYMRLGKLRGPNHRKSMPMGPFRTHTTPVNVRDLERFDAGVEVTPDLLPLGRRRPHAAPPDQDPGRRRALDAS